MQTAQATELALANQKALEEVKAQLAAPVPPPPPPAGVSQIDAQRLGAQIVQVVYRVVDDALRAKGIAANPPLPKPTVAAPAATTTTTTTTPPSRR